MANDSVGKALATTAAIGAVQHLKGEALGPGQVLEMAVPMMMIAGEHARAAVAALGHKVGLLTGGGDHKLWEEVARGDQVTRANAAKLVREALEATDERALDALAALAVEYLTPPGRRSDAFFRGAAEFFSRADDGETDAVHRVGKAALAALDAPVLTLIAFDAAPEGHKDRKTWPLVPWHVRVHDAAAIGGLRDSRAIIPEPLAETLVARLKLHRLGGASEADFFGAHPDACDIRRDVLVRLVELTAPGRHATA